MHKTRVLLIGMMMLLLVSLPLLNACGDEETATEVTAETEVTMETEATAEPEFKGEIHIQLLNWLTGPAAAFSDHTWANLDFWRDVNEKGGIDGYEVVLHWIDTGYDVSRVLSAYSEFTSENPIVATTCHITGGGVALMPRAAEDKIPLYVTPAMDQLNFPAQPWTFGSAQPSYSDMARAVMVWALDKWEEPRPLNLGIAYAPNPFGESAHMALVDYAQDMNYEVVAKQELEFGAVDATSQALAFKSAEVDLVYIQCTENGAATLCRDMERQGVEPKWIIGSPQITSRPFIDLGKGASEDVYGLTNYTTWPQHLDDELVKYWRDKAVEYDHGGIDSEEDPYLSGYYLMGIAHSYVLLEALNRAAEKVGAGNITGQDVRDATESITDLSYSFMPAVSYSPDDHRGMYSIGIMQVRDGEWSPLIEWLDAPPVPERVKGGK